MKSAALFFFLLIFLDVHADAGFSIRRKKAASNIDFSGIENMKSHIFIRFLYSI